MLNTLLVVLVGLLMLGASGARSPGAQGPEEFRLKSGGVIRFLVSEPPALSPDATVPVLIALPPGKQNAEMGEMAESMYWRGLREKGWVVVTPLARGESTLLDDAGSVLPELVEELLRRYRAEGGKVHVAGVSNGGRAAFRAALGVGASRVASLTVLPGFAPAKEDIERLAELRGVVVRMFVGETDTADWIEASRATVGALRGHGVDASLTIRQGEGHVLKLTADDVTSLLESTRPARAEGAKSPAEELDDFHGAAAAADGARYFGHFAQDGVFLGTDAGERWTVAEFRAYAEPYFSQGKGWTYTPRDRRVSISKGGDTAWFDEKLDNEKYGECRGSGVMVLEQGRWKIAQYNLTVPVPNDMLADVARQIREFKAGAPKKE